MCHNYKINNKISIYFEYYHCLSYMQVYIIDSTTLKYNTNEVVLY